MNISSFQSDYNYNKALHNKRLSNSLQSLHSLNTTTCTKLTKPFQNNTLYFPKENRTQNSFNNNIRNILQNDPLYSTMKFNNQDYSMSMEKKAYVLGGKDRKKITRYDDWVSKKSLQYPEQYNRKSFSITKFFSANDYKDYYKYKKSKALPTPDLIKENDDKKFAQTLFAKKNRDIAKDYKKREWKAVVFDPPPKFNEIRIEDCDNNINTNNNIENHKERKSLSPRSPQQNISTFLGKKNLLKSHVFPNSDTNVCSSDFFKKTGEKYFFQPVNKVYHANVLSNSVWIPSHSNPSLFNHTNNEFNILNPAIKSHCKTKKEIITKENGHTITHKQKALGEFVDITRNGSPNPNKDFVNVFKTYSRPFNRQKNQCSEFALMAHPNKEFLGSMFTTKK